MVLRHVKSRSLSPIKQPLPPPPPVRFEKHDFTGHTLHFDLEREVPYTIPQDERMDHIRIMNAMDKYFESKEVKETLFRVLKDILSEGWPNDD